MTCTCNLCNIKAERDVALARVAQLEAESLELIKANEDFAERCHTLQISLEVANARAK